MPSCQPRVIEFHKETMVGGKMMSKITTPRITLRCRKTSSRFTAPTITQSARMTIVMRAADPTKPPHAENNLASIIALFLSSAA